MPSIRNQDTVPSRRDRQTTVIVTWAVCVISVMLSIGYARLYKTDKIQRRSRGKIVCVRPLKKRDTTKKIAFDERDKLFAVQENLS